MGAGSCSRVGHPKRQVQCWYERMWNGWGELVIVQIAHPRITLPDGLGASRSGHDGVLNYNRLAPLGGSAAYDEEGAGSRSCLRIKMASRPLSSETRLTSWKPRSRANRRSGWSCAYSVNHTCATFLARSAVSA
jgi:hypothetical protein